MPHATRPTCCSPATDPTAGRGRAVFRARLSGRQHQRNRQGSRHRGRSCHRSFKQAWTLHPPRQWRCLEMHPKHTAKISKQLLTICAALSGHVRISLDAPGSGGSVGHRASLALCRSTRLTCEIQGDREEPDRPHRQALVPATSVAQGRHCWSRRLHRRRRSHLASHALRRSRRRDQWPGAGDPDQRGE